jgi:hypothetical protein
VLNRIAYTVALMAGLSIGASRALADTPRLEGQAGRCLITHARLHIDSHLRATVHAMWHRSPTFRRQVARLSQEAGLHTSLNIWLATRSANTRAETVLRHAEGRLRTATVRIRLPNSVPTIVELIAHELEHIVEQLDGVNLRRSIDRGGMGAAVRRSHGGAFETERAHRVGLAVRDEYLRQPDAPSCVEVLP